MRAAVLVSLIAAMGLSACATRTAQPAAPAARMAWSLYETPEEGAKLAFGAPGSDDVPLLLSCRPGSGRVAVNVGAPDEQPRDLALSSGRATSRFPAAFQPDLGEGSRLEATGPAAAPALTRFAATGELAVQADGRRLALPTLDPRQAGKFMKTCRFG